MHNNGKTRNIESEIVYSEYTEDKENLDTGSSLEADKQSDRQMYGEQGTKSVKFCLEKDDQSVSRNNRIQRRSQSGKCYCLQV